MLSLHRATVADNALRLGYTSVIFVDLRVKVDGTYYCDLLLSQQLLSAISYVSSEFILENNAQHIQHAMFSDINISQVSVVTA